jgi:ubiquitin carboxyl-terminal hydrolase L3
MTIEAELTQAGCDKIRPLWRLYVAEDTHIIYVHNVIDERLEESLEGVRDAAAMMEGVGAQHLWVVFNKQDLLPMEQASPILTDHRRRFEIELSTHGSGLNWQIVDQPGFSAMYGNRCDELLDVLYNTITMKKTSTSNHSEPPIRSSNDTPTERELIERIEKERSHDLDAEEFWSRFLSADITEWNHR